MEEKESPPGSVYSPDDQTEKPTPKPVAGKVCSQRSLPSSVRRSVKQVHNSIQTLSTRPNETSKAPRNNVKSQKSPEHVECARCGKITDRGDAIPVKHDLKLDPALEGSQATTCLTRPDRKVASKRKKLRTLKKNAQKHKSEMKAAKKDDPKLTPKQDLVKKAPEIAEHQVLIQMEPEEELTGMPKKEFISPSASSEDDALEIVKVESPTATPSEEECKSADEESKAEAADSETPTPLAPNPEKEDPGSEKEDKIDLAMAAGNESKDGALPTEMLPAEFREKCFVEDINDEEHGAVTMERVFLQGTVNVYHPPAEEYQTAEEPEEDRYLRYQRVQIVSHLQAVSMIYSEIRNDRRMKYLEQVMIQQLGLGLRDQRESIGQEK